MNETQWLIRGRGQYKTTTAVEWVKQGKRTKKWPGWSRVLITHNMQEADRLRNTMREVLGLDYHQVFFWDEWIQSAHGLVGGRVEVAIDNADIILNYLLTRRTHVSVGLITATGYPVPDDSQVGELHDV